MVYINGKKILFSPIVNITNTPATLIEKEITENGTYNAIDEGADGFSSVTVNVASANSEADIVDGFLQGTLSGVYYNDRITSVRPYVFRGLNTITGVDFPNVTEIKDNAFYDNSKLESAIIPNVTKIGITSFYNSGLKNIYLPNLTAIPQQAFTNCASLVKAHFSKTTSLGYDAFYNCQNLLLLIVETPTLCKMTNAKPLGKTNIANGMGFICVPDDLVEDYKVATNWATYASQIKGISELENGQILTFTIVCGYAEPYIVGGIVTAGTKWSEWAAKENEKQASYGSDMWYSKNGYLFNDFKQVYATDSNGNAVKWTDEIFGGEYGSVSTLPIT